MVGIGHLLDITLRLISNFAKGEGASHWEGGGVVRMDVEPIRIFACVDVLLGAQVYGCRSSKCR